MMKTPIEDFGALIFTILGIMRKSADLEDFYRGVGSIGAEDADVVDQWNRKSAAVQGAWQKTVIAMILADDYRGRTLLRGVRHMDSDVVENFRWSKLRRNERMLWNLAAVSVKRLSEVQTGSKFGFRSGDRELNRPH
ncbi:MAG: hypothetical protein OXD01_02615 [Gammaproteobacteria bacterium]|nr:hypothetical protein [Gammaproteobacteria bacterium]